MSRAVGVFVLASLTFAGGWAAAQVEHAKERADTATFQYSFSDDVVGGRMAQLYVSVGPTWPPSDRVQVSYQGQQCTIGYCFSFPPLVYCGCDFMAPQEPFSGTGLVPASAFSVSPQGVSQLDFEAAEIENGWTSGTCGGLHLTATPNGEWHWSEDGQITVRTPTDSTRAVSRADEWVTAVTGTACSLTLTAQSPGTGRVWKRDWNRVVRSPNP